MNLHEEIREITSQISLSDIITELGYSNAEIFKVSTRIRYINQSKSLSLNETRFDFRYSNREFLIRLCKVIGIDSERCLNEIERINAEIEKEKYSYKTWIFVETDFTRKNEPIFALAAMESTRRIKIQNEISALPLNEQIPLVKQIIREHFIDCDGELPMWGKISYYKFFYAKDASIIFDVNGDLIIQGADFPPPTAKVLVKGKRLFRGLEFEDV